MNLPPVSHLIIHTNAQSAPQDCRGELQTGIPPLMKFFWDLPKGTSQIWPNETICMSGVDGFHHHLLCDMALPIWHQTSLEVGAQASHLYSTRVQNKLPFRADFERCCTHTRYLAGDSEQEKKTKQHPEVRGIFFLRRDPSLHLTLVSWIHCFTSHQLSLHEHTQSRIPQLSKIHRITQITLLIVFLVLQFSEMSGGGEEEAPSCVQALSYGNYSNIKCFYVNPYLRLKSWWLL